MIKLFFSVAKEIHYKRCCKTDHLRDIRFFTKKSGEIETYFNAALNLTKKVGQIIKEKNSEKKKIETKTSDIDFVTETDRQVENLLIDGLSSQFPGHKFIGEETVAAGGQSQLTNAPTWIIDPVDGTMNFVHSFPHSCVSIGLFIDSLPQIGIIYNPMLEQLFTAIKGKGAHLNGSKIHVSGETNLSNALIMIENVNGRDPDRVKAALENFKNLVPHIHGVRSLGSAALNMSMVAVGAVDAYYDYGFYIWDIAAGELIITEAGGVVIDPAGGPIDRLSRRMLCAATPQLAEELSKKLVPFYRTPKS